MKILLMKKSPKKLKNIEIISTSGYTIDYNAEILNPFNSELQLKDTVSWIRNKRKHSLAGLEGFKFMMILGLEFKKIKWW